MIGPSTSRGTTMDEGAIDTYLDAAYKNFKIQPTFPPGALVEVGWIGKMDNGQFVPTSDLNAHGYRFQKRTIAMPAMRFATAGAVDFIASSKGKLSKAVSAVASADAGLKIAFKKESAIAIVLDPVSETYIKNVDAVSAWMDGPGRKKLDEDHVIVTHVRRAKSGVIAMAQTAGAEVQLKTDVSLGQGKVALGSVGGKLNFVTSNSTEFVSTPSGRSGLTPFYRVLHFTSHRSPLDIVLGRGGRKGVDFSKERLELTYRDYDVALAPYDKDLFKQMSQRDSQ
jgi:hypothetical protein